MRSAKNNDLVWHLPNDFKRFKALTSGHHIIMGRKTLKVSRNPHLIENMSSFLGIEGYNPEGCIVVNSMEKSNRACPQEEDVL
jgi:dihydrofolate reductase